MFWDNDKVNSSATAAIKWWCDATLFSRHGVTENFWNLDGHVVSRNYGSSASMISLLWGIHTYGNVYKP
jgi:hypothetical protein